MGKRPKIPTAECATNEKLPNARCARGPITGSSRHLFSWENEKLTDRGWSDDGREKEGEKERERERRRAGPMEGRRGGKKKR